MIGWLAGFLTAWLFVGGWWTFELITDAEDLRWRHILMGGPAFWIALAVCFLWILSLGINAIYSDCMSAIHLWAVRPVDRAVEEYLTNGGCHERH